MNAFEEIGKLLARFQAMEAAGHPGTTCPTVYKVGIEIEWDPEAKQWEMAPWFQIPGTTTVEGEYSEPMSPLALSHSGKGATLTEAGVAALANLKDHLPRLGIPVD
jgi:hypothetical protein